MKIKAIITGATGMVGEGVLLECLNNDDVAEVLVVGRRPCGVEHAKLKEIVHKDMGDLEPIASELKGYNACYFCLGVSSMGKSETEYTKLTYDLTLGAAGTLARLNPDMTFCYVTGRGTDGTEQGSSMWARVKGKTENDLFKLPFKAAYMFRPGMIEPYPGQKNMYTIYKVLGWSIPFWKAVAPSSVGTMRDLALAMIRVARDGGEKRVLEVKDIRESAAS